MIHKTSIIEKGAKIGKNVIIGPYCIVSGKAKLEDNVHLKSHVVIEGKVTIGEGTVIYPFASLSYPQTLKYKGEDSEIIIGKNNTIREYVTIQHGTSEGSMVTTTGDNCLFMVGVHIAHNCVIGNNAIFANYVSLAGHVKVADFVTIGGLSAIQQFTRIGSHVMIGGMTGISKDLPPYLLAGNKCANIDGLNLVGMKRRNFDKLKTIEANKAVKTLFTEDPNKLFEQRLDEAQEQYQDNEIVQEIIDFVRVDNTRSFCKFKK